MLTCWFTPSRQNVVLLCTLNYPEALHFLNRQSTAHYVAWQTLVRGKFSSVCLEPISTGNPGQDFKSWKGNPNILMAVIIANENKTNKNKT